MNTSRLLLTALVFFITIAAKAQSHDGMYFQGAARNANGNILASTSINLRYSIHDSLASGVVVYQETFSTTTSAQGMFSIVIGKGTPVNGTFNTINWGTNEKFVQVELSTNGGSSYTDMGTTQMMSVPYTLYAKNGVPNGNAGDILVNNGTNWQKLPIGQNGQVLTVDSGIIKWKFINNNNIDIFQSFASSFFWKNSDTIVFDYTVGAGISGFPDRRAHV